MKTLFPHQEKCLSALFKYFEINSGNPVCVVPVGGGKSLLQAEFCKRANNLFPGTKFAIVTHVTELLLQIHEEFISQWPEANVSFYADKLGHKNLSGDIILGSIQSIYKKALSIPKAIDILIVDECHLISPKDETMYRRFINDLKIVNPKLKIVGFTGTNFRTNSGLLTEGEDRLFTDVAYQIPMLELINKGFLSPLITPQEPMKTKMSIEGVKTRGGDYVIGELEKAIDKDPITKGCVDEIIAHGKNRNKWLVFTAGVEHCLHVMEEIKSRGISCEMVVGTTPPMERASIITRYKCGEIKCLVCVAIFTTGFNCPEIDMLALMRPMKSPVLYVQCGGRGMRTSPGKENCLVLDFGDIISTLGPIDTIDARILNKKKGDGEAPVKICPKCEAVNFAGVRVCSDCGFEFPFDERTKLNTEASGEAILSSQQKPVRHAVISTQYSRHKGKDGKKDTLRVKYVTYTGDYAQFVCIEHTGFAREKSCQWHRQRLPNIKMPNTIDDALKLKYPSASDIFTKKNGKYYEVVEVKFNKDELEEILPPLTDFNSLAEFEDIGI